MPLALPRRQPHTRPADMTGTPEGSSILLASRIGECSIYHRVHCTYVLVQKTAGLGRLTRLDSRRLRC